MSRDKSELYWKIMFVKLFVIVITCIDFKHYPSTYCLMQGTVYG